MSHSRLLRSFTVIAVACLAPFVQAQDREISSNLNAIEKELRGARPNPTFVKKKARELVRQTPTQLKKFGLNDATEESAPSLNLSEDDIDKMQAHYDDLADDLEREAESPSASVASVAAALERLNRFMAALKRLEQLNPRTQRAEYLQTLNWLRRPNPQ